MKLKGGVNFKTGAMAPSNFPCGFECEIRTVAFPAQMKLNQVLKASGQRMAQDVAQQLGGLSVRKMAVVS